MKKLLYLLGTLLILVTSILLFNNKTSYSIDYKLNNKTSMYLWNLKDVDYSSLDKTIDYLNIDTIYVGSYSDLTSYKNTLYFNYAEEKRLNSYLVYGENYEDQDIILRQIKDLIDKTYEFNNNSSYKVKGIAIDSEFHTTQVYKDARDSGNHAKMEEIFSKYVSIMKEAKQYANSKGLELVSCIPWNYDTNISETILEELIKDGSDYVQIMNYTKKNSVRNISKEIELARKYNKKIESIAELNEPGPHGIEDIITFWNDGLDACTNKFKEIEDEYNYDNLYFNYHAYSSVIQLAGDIIDFTNEFNYELYTTDIDGNTLSLNNIYLENDNEKIKGLSFYNKETSKYEIYFYNVKYNTTYNIVVENSNYITETNTVIFIKEESRLKTETRVFKVSEEQPVVPETPSITIPVIEEKPIKEEIVSIIEEVAPKAETILKEHMNDNKVVVKQPEPTQTTQKQPEPTKEPVKEEKEEQKEEQNVVLKGSDELKENTTNKKNTIAILITIILIISIIVILFKSL